MVTHQQFSMLRVVYVRLTSSQCSAKWLEPGRLWNRSSSISACVKSTSPRCAFTVQWSKAVLRSLCTEHAAATTATTFGRLPRCLYGAVWEANHSLWQLIGGDQRQWRQDCDSMHAWDVIVKLCHEFMFMLCCVNIVH